MASWKTAALLVAVSIGTVGVYVGIFVIDTTKDNPATLDNQPTKGVAARACTTLRLDLDGLPALPATASPQQRAARVATENQAVDRLVSTVRALGEATLRKDVPADQWLGDWTTLAAARTAYAAAGSVGPFTPPIVDGHPLTERMGNALPDCVVPVSLTVAP